MTALSTPTKLDPAFFEVIPHLDVLSRLMILQNANGRFPIAHTKTRSERRGSTRKLTNQKGAGRSRKGSNRSPSRKGGGVAFGPRNNANFQVSMNAGERRLGLASALTLKAQEDRVRVLEKLDTKTQAMAKVLKDIITENTALVFVSPEEAPVSAALSNLHGVQVAVVTHASPADILKNDYCVFTEEAMKTLSSHFIA